MIDAGEEIDTYFVCNGEDGADGSNGSDGSNGRDVIVTSAAAKVLVLPLALRGAVRRASFRGQESRRARA